MKKKRITFNIISSITLFINYQLFYKRGLIGIFGDRFLIIRIAFGLLTFLLLSILSKKSFKNCKYFVFLSLLFSIFLFVGDSYRLFGTIIVPFYPKMIVLSILKYLGLFNSMNILLLNIDNAIKTKKSRIINSKFMDFFDKHPFLTPFLVITIAWCIYYIAFYPIVLSPDPSYQIKQALGERTKYSDYSVQIDPNVNITNHHPVIHTLMLGGFVKLGRLIANDNFGLFLYSLVQGLFMAMTLAYTIKYLHFKKVSNDYLIIMIIIYALVPMFPFYAINANKDVCYTMFIIWLLMLLFDVINTHEKLTLKKSLIWFIILILICLFRNNGIYLVAFLLPLFVFYNFANAKKTIIIFMFCILTFFGYKNVLLPKLKITDTSPREKMSIFFQQTALYVIRHESDLTVKDKKVISNIINYDNIKKKYNPVLADPIKNSFNKYATSEDLKAYYRVWFKGFLKHPVTYVDATLHNTYGYLDVGQTSWYIYYKYDSRVANNNLVDYHYNKLEKLRTILTYYGLVFPCIPIIGLISNIGFNSWILIAYLFWLLKNHKHKYIAFLVPLLVSLLVCFASPVNTYFRYAMPFVFSTPFIVGTWLLIKKEKN